LEHNGNFLRAPSIDNLQFFLFQESIDEIFYTLKEAKTLIEKWRMEYNTFRPHSSLNYRSPAPEAYLN
jgi:transposase InsO family protein